MNNRIMQLLLICCISLNAYSQGPSDLYVKTLNSYVAGSPEASQLMRYQDYPVNLFTGTPQIAIPIYTLSGKGIAVPISLSYHASGGVKVDELATNIGLGWSLSAGGEITREIRGGEDEGGSVGSTGNGTAGFLNKAHPMWWYKNMYDATVSLSPNNPDPNQQIWVEAMNGHLDMEPDMFYFNLGGYSGKFVYDDSLGKFICLTEKSHLDITFDHSSSASSFTIITDDGTKYYFANREYSKSMSQNMGVGGNITPWSGGQVSSWKLSKIINADQTDSIIFNYQGISYKYLSGGADITYQVTGFGGQTRNPIKSFSTAWIDGESDLVSIEGANFKVVFEKDVTNRTDLVGINKALSKIIVKDKESNIQDIFVLHHSYFLRSSKVGPVPATGDVIQTSLRLDSISEYGNSENNLYPLRHAFRYNIAQLPARLSYAKDWWGYANYNDYPNTLVPATVQPGGIITPGADRHIDLGRMQAGILEQIRLPTGGTVDYEYEPNTTAFPVPQATPPENMILHVSQRIMEQRPPNHGFADSTIYFTINEQPNGYTNSFSEGVDANIWFYPIGTSSSPYLEDTLPSFTIDKYAELNNDPPGYLSGFHRTYQSQGAQQEHFPNGKYVMKFLVGNYNQHLPTPTFDGGPETQVNNIEFTITYNLLDTSGAVINYSLAGSRVKSITTKDQFANTTNIRRFIYHDPVRDSSYGRYIGQGMHTYIETSQSGQWQVQMGSSNMPGWGNEYANVVYPKVMEEVTESGITYRTEHYFTKGLGIFPMYSTTWPFYPVDDVESMRGNEYKTVMNRYNGPGDFSPAIIQQKVFDSLPPILSDPTKHYGRMLYGIKCSAASYDQNTVVSGGYAPPFVAVYYISAGYRNYLASDSTTTYDLNSQYKSITTWHDYTYGDYNLKPILARTGNSDGIESVVKNWYPTDQPESNSYINTSVITGLINKNRVGDILGTNQYKGNQLLSQQYPYSHFSGSKYLMDSVKQSLYSSTPETEIKVLKYDNYANPLTIEMRGGKFRKYIWNSERSLPLATIVTPIDGFFYFDSFEYGNGSTGSSFSGSKAYSLSTGNSFTISSTVTGSFGATEVYVWATGASFSVNGNGPSSTGRTKAGWTLYKIHLTGGSGISITATGSITIDQLAIYPSGSQFRGNVYDVSNKVIAVINEGMSTGFYDYDEYGRLENIRDEKGNIISSTAYQYQGAQ